MSMRLMLLKKLDRGSMGDYCWLLGGGGAQWKSRATRLSSKCGALKYILIIVMCTI